MSLPHFQLILFLCSGFGFPVSFSDRLDGLKRKNGDSSGMNLLPEPEPYIIGGMEATLHEFPSIIALWRKDSPTSDYQQSCTATIVNKNWLVTAAHCITGPNQQFVTIAGAHDTAKLNGGEQWRFIADVQSHPLYSNRTTFTDYDIALMMFSAPLQFNANVKRATLASNPKPVTGMGTAAGWGVTSVTVGGNPPMATGGTPTTVLRTDKLPLVDWNDCFKAATSNKKFLSKRYVCAGGEAGKGACYGDSGGPLYVPGPLNIRILLGVAGFPLDFPTCATAGNPVAYSDVAYFRSYIECVTKYTVPLTKEQNILCAKDT